MNLNPGHVGKYFNNSGPVERGFDASEAIESRAAKLRNCPQKLYDEVFQWDSDLMRELEEAIFNLELAQYKRNVDVNEVLEASKAVSEVFQKAAEKKAAQELDQRFVRSAA